MATLDEVLAALRNADAAGDAEAAKRLAEIARSMQSSPPARPEVDTLEGMGRSFVQGGTFGAGDEIVAGGVALKNELLQLAPETFADIGESLGLPGVFSSVDRPMGEVYDASLENERTRLDDFRDQEPILAYGSEIVGAIPTAVGTGGAGLGANSLRAKMLLGGLEAGGQGFVYGFNAGEGGAGERLEDGLLTGALSAPLGVAAPMLGHGVRNLTERLLTRPAAAAAGLTKPAYDIATRVMGADGALTGPGATRLVAAGDDAMIADAGPSASALLDVAIQRGGPATVIGRDAVESRASDANTVLTNAFDSAFGQPAGIRSTENAIRTGSAPARVDAYDLAYSQIIDYSTPEGMALEQIVRTRVPESAIRAANELMRLEGNQSSQILIKIADDGSVLFETIPDVRQLDYITRGLNQVADAANGQGQLGGTTPLGLATSNLAREIRDLTKTLVPEYSDALSTAAHAIEARNALRLGADALSTRITRDELAEQLAGMTDAELTFVAQGIRSQLDEALANVRRAMTDSNMDAREAVAALRALSSRAAREKIAMVIGEDAANELFSTIDRATMGLDLRSAVATNSKTFARTSIDDAVAAQTDDGVINALRSGQPLNATQRFVQTVMGRTADDKARIADETYSSLVNMLTGPRGQDALTTLLQLQAAGQGIPAAANAHGRLTQQLLRPFAPSAGVNLESLIR